MRFLQLFKQKLQVFNAVSYQYQLRAKKRPDDISLRQIFRMGQRLLSESPQFAAILAELDAAMRPLAGFSLIEELLQAGPDTDHHDAMRGLLRAALQDLIEVYCLTERM